LQKKLAHSECFAEKICSALPNWPKQHQLEASLQFGLLALLAGSLGGRIFLKAVVVACRRQCLPA
jgi:hypothetical protein